MRKSLTIFFLSFIFLCEGRYCTMFNDDRGLFIDWLSFTYKPDEEYVYNNFTCVFDCFRAEFPELHELWESPVLFSRGYYNSVAVFTDNIRISYNLDAQNPEMERKMGVNVDIPSHGLEWFYTCIGLKCDADVLDVFGWLEAHHCQLARLDITFDDFGKRFSPSWYFQKCLNHHFRSYFKRSRRVDDSAPICLDGALSATSKLGQTFYIGSRKSDRFMRIYDKDAQTDGEIPSIRYESELHGRAARDFMTYVMCNGMPSFKEWLTSFFEVLTEDSKNCTNISDVPLDADWAEWLDSLDTESAFCEKLHVPHYSLLSRQKSVTYWLEHQCMGNIYAFVNVFGWSRLHELCDEFDKTKIPKRWQDFIAYQERAQELQFTESLFGVK